MKYKKFVCIVFVLYILNTLSCVVLADQTIPINPKDLPKQDASIHIPYAGEVTSITVQTPDNRSLTGIANGNGSINIYLGNAPVGTYNLIITGTFTNFGPVTITGTDPIAPPTETAPPPPSLPPETTFVTSVAPPATITNTTTAPAAPPTTLPTETIDQTTRATTESIVTPAPDITTLSTETLVPEIQIEYFSEPKIYISKEDIEIFEDPQKTILKTILKKDEKITIIGTIDLNTIGVTEKFFYLSLNKVKEFIETESETTESGHSLTSPSSEVIEISSTDTIADHNDQEANEKKELNFLSFFVGHKKKIFAVLICILLVSTIFIFRKKLKCFFSTIYFKRRKISKNKFFLFNDESLVLEEEMVWNWNIKDILEYTNSSQIIDFNAIIIDLGCTETSSVFAYSLQENGYQNNEERKIKYIKWKEQQK